MRLYTPLVQRIKTTQAEKTEMYTSTQKRNYDDVRLRKMCRYGKAQGRRRARKERP